MSKFISNKHTKSIVTGLALGLVTATTAVGAAGVDTLDGADTDYSHPYKISYDESAYGSGAKQASFVLEQDYYEYTPRRIDGLETAEFAAFEVPDHLVVSD